MIKISEMDDDPRYLAYHCKRCDIRAECDKLPQNRDKNDDDYNPIYDNCEHQQQIVKRLLAPVPTAPILFECSECQCKFPTEKIHKINDVLVCVECYANGQKYCEWCSGSPPYLPDSLCGKK